MRNRILILAACLLLVLMSAAGLGVFVLGVLNTRTKETLSLSGPNAPLTTPPLSSSQPPRIPRSAPPIDRFPPGFNYALAANGGKVTGGANPELLNDGVYTGYTGGTGYGFTQWAATPPQSFLISLKEPAEINCVRFLLWDLELDRFYRYKVELAVDQAKPEWKLAADRSGKDDECRGWQVVRFERQKVQAIRVTGTYNSANSGFHVVELEACIEPPKGFPPQRGQYAPGKPVEVLEF